uniref:Transcobalamin 1 n=1 Tax=Loxodonta africana TaxID=9785 RepID=G3U1Z9_LOXAF
MRQLLQLPLVGLLLFFLTPSQQSKICVVDKKDESCLNPLLSTMNNSKYTNEVQAAHVLLSLRLVRIKNQNLEQRLMEIVKNTTSRKGSDLSSGQLAWTIMALGACHNPNENFSNDFQLVHLLEKKFQEEIKNMGAHNGNSLTNYYQLSQGLLALCLFSGNYSVTEIAELFTPENENYYFSGQFSVDTGAMAVVALTCVKRSIEKQKIEADTTISVTIDNHIKSLIKKILSEKKENGLIRNIYSTGEAMQALFVSKNNYEQSEWNCKQTLDTVLKEISQGAFSTPTAAAQILPALMGKTYLYVNKDSPCVSGSDFNVSAPVPGSVTPENSPSAITVRYSVQINETYSTNVTVPNGSVFLDVMKEAQKQNKTVFDFTVEETSWGPYVTCVQGLSANNNDRTYWEILSGPKPLSQGVGSYVVHDGESLMIRWSKY